MKVLEDAEMAKSRLPKLRRASFKKHSLNA